MNNPGIKELNSIIKNTLNVISQSKDAIFDISENARKEVEILKEELLSLQAVTAQVINECKQFEQRVLQGRQKLASINRNFEQYTEKEMKGAYEVTNNLIVEMAVCREREKNTILRRNEVERRLKEALITVKKAEMLVAQVGAAFDYLSGNLSNLDGYFEKTESKRLLALRIIEAQENERNRIARDIHDGPAQAMSNVVIMAEICEKTAEVSIEKALTELQGLKEVVRACLKDVRRIIYDLRPMSIDDLGLGPTLQKHIKGFSKDSGIRVDFKIKDEDRSMKNSNVTLAIFRTVQESLNNTYKHANATYINVQVEFINKSILLRISDDGCGFDTTITQESTKYENSGFGILGIRERVELLEGDFKIESKINTGTTIMVRLPYIPQEVS